MTYLLDTDTVVSLLRGHAGIRGRLEAEGDEAIATTAINLAELYYGAFRSARPRENVLTVDAFRALVQLYDFDERAAVVFGEVKSALARSGVLLEDADLFVASVALSTESTLVTGNTRHFDRIESLRLENWMT